MPKENVRHMILVLEPPLARESKEIRASIRDASRLVQPIGPVTAKLSTGLIYFPAQVSVKQNVVVADGDNLFRAAGNRRFDHVLDERCPSRIPENL